MKTSLTLMLVLFLNGFLYSQETSQIVNPDILKKQKEVLTESFPGIFIPEKILNVVPIDSNNSKVLYTEEGVYKEAIVRTHGPKMLLIATCIQITQNATPKIVLNAFNTSKYNKWTINKIFSVSTPYSSPFYRIDIYPDADHKKNIKSLFYNYLGEYQTPPY